MRAVWNPQANAIFLEALEQPAAERKAFLQGACGVNDALREEVEGLLRSHQEAGSFLNAPLFDSIPTIDRPAISGGPQTTLPDEFPLDFLVPAESPDALGRIGPYEVTERIGRGGMGLVLKARDAKLNRVVAIKVMASELAVSPTARKRFAREAQAAAAVVHQHVVTIHAVEEDRLPYLVMEYIDGQSLQQKIDREGHLELREILRIGQQVAAGLAAAHAHGLMHRDVKPANILLENGVERVRITDFGLARAVDDVGMTRTGEVAGTPQYMSPEQVQGLPMDARSDLFSLGCVLYAMCTGRSPFRAETTFATVRRVCEDTPRPIREVNPEIPQWLVDIVDRLLVKRPAERFQSSAEVSELLSRHLAEVQHPSAVGQSPAPVVKSPRSAASPSRPLLWTAAAVLLCAALLLGLSEAGGVTKLTTSVIRVLTPQGTLIIEVDDPGVTVTVEDNGGLVITGAGPREVRLPVGKYTVRATKDGQPVKEEIVSITRNGKKTVSVTLEIPVAAVARPEAQYGPWVSLFNERDLTGWDAQGGQWRVEEGTLTCSGPQAHLMTVRDDFSDFHLRAEVKINAGGNSGIYFRAGKPLTLIGDYEAQITDNSDQQNKTGSLFALVRVSQSPVSPDTWFTLEVIAEGKRIRILVNGKQTADYTENRSNRNAKGHIALQHLDPGTRVFFRKIEIKELPAAKAAADRAFVLLGGKGVAERKFGTLAEAVQGASTGDTIEIRGNGPFISDGVTISQRLVIRAGEGYAPSITLSQAAADRNIPLLTTSTSLVLEGLELRRIGGALGRVENRWPVLIEAWRDQELHVANCRLIFIPSGVSISTKAAALTVRNSELSGGAICGWRYATGGRCTIDNCVSPVGGIWIQQDEPDVLNVSIRVRGNTFVGDCIRWELFTKPNLPEKMATPPIQLDFSRNVARCGEASFKWGVLVFRQLKLKEPYSAAEAEALLQRMVGLAEKQNVYQSVTQMFQLAVDENLLKGTRDHDLADWNQFWALKDTGSVAGDVRFQGGDLNVRALTAPEKLTAEDFRLRADSAGYRAGPGGKDLGADVDLVGPGAAYELWKKSPEYEQWLKQTGQKE